MKDLRYERKFKISSFFSNQLDSLISVHPAGFTTQYPDRQVNNVYFDTPELKTFSENVFGVPIRAKYRMRWYGQDMDDIIDPVFEVKKKENELGFKTSKKGPSINKANLANITQRGIDHFESQLSLQPTLINSYLRSYFLSADGLFRLTVDRELRFYFAMGVITIPISYTEMDDVIIELKYDKLEDEKAKELMRFIPFRQTKNSKYVSGIYATIQ